MEEHLGKDIKGVLVGKYLVCIGGEKDVETKVSACGREV